MNPVDQLKNLVSLSLLRRVGIVAIDESPKILSPDKCAQEEDKDKARLSVEVLGDRKDNEEEHEADVVEADLTDSYYKQYEKYQDVHVSEEDEGEAEEYGLSL